MKPDIFDKIMARKPFSVFQPFYMKYKEVLLYLFFGGLTFFLSMSLFWVLTIPLGMNALFANAVDWIICVIFAYATNRTWVFKVGEQNAKGVMRESVSFLIGRLGTLALEEAVLWLGIDLLHINGMLVKLVAQLMVIVGNYVISKFFVFKEKADGGHGR